MLQRPYRGHGGLSAGASSRLLMDYRDPQRSEILDVLFKPGYGASVHMLKIEIGESHDHRRQIFCAGSCRHCLVAVMDCANRGR